MNQKIENINERIIGRRPRLAGTKNGREAAVMLPLIWRVNEESQIEEWHILFEVRSHKLQMQPGDICFPGGGIDREEKPQETALREVCEELFVTKEQVEILGEIDGTLGPTGAPMWAFAGIIHDYTGTFSEDETDEVFYVPLKELLAMKPVEGTVHMYSEPAEDFPMELIPGGVSYRWHTKDQQMYFYPWKKHIIWGATAGILHEFLERIR